MELKLKRVYEKPVQDDGLRVLVDRLWPRGLKKADAAVDLWLKEIAPSDDLRKWFGHDPEKWAQFRSRYRDELKKNEAPVAMLRAKGGKGRVTLLYAAHDEAHNNAVALKDFLEKERQG